MTIEKQQRLYPGRRLALRALAAISLLSAVVTVAAPAHAQFAYTGDENLYLYDLRVRPNVVLGVTDTKDMVQFAYPYQQGYYRNCTVNSQSSCPSACGPIASDWGGVNYNCPSFHYGIQAPQASISFLPANCSLNDPLLEHLNTAPNRVDGVRDITVRDVSSQYCEITQARFRDPTTGTPQVRILYYTNTATRSVPYSGDEWNQATSTIHSALWAALFARYDTGKPTWMDSGVRFHGYLRGLGTTADQWFNYSNRFRVAFQRLNMLPPSSVLGASFLSNTTIQKSGLPSPVPSATTHDGLGGCMISGATPLPFTTFYTDMLRYMFWPAGMGLTYTTDDTKGFVSYQNLAAGSGACTIGASNLGSCPDNRPKEYLPLAEMLGDAGQFFWGAAGDFCRQGYGSSTWTDYVSPVGNGALQEDYAQDAFLYANNMALMIVTDEPSHDNGDVLRKDWRAVGGSNIGDHDFSCSTAASCAIFNNCCTDTQAFNQPDFSTTFAAGFKTSADPGYTAAVTNDYHGLKTNFLDDMAAALWHIDTLQDPSSNYGAGYRAPCADEHFGAGRASDCRRQAVSTDIIAAIESQLFSDASTQSMGIAYATTKFDGQDKWLYTCRSINGKVETDCFERGFGRNCEFSPFPDKCYEPGTMARALNNWFVNAQYRNVNIDRPYYMTPPVLAIDAGQPNNPNSNMLLINSFVPTPSAMYEGHLQAFDFAIGVAGNDNSGIYATGNDIDATCGGFGNGRRLRSKDSTVFAWEGASGITQPFQRNGQPVVQAINGADDLLASWEDRSKPVLQPIIPSPTRTIELKIPNRRLLTRSRTSGTALVEFTNLINDLNLDLRDFDLLEAGTKSSSQDIFISNDINNARKATVLERVYNGVRSFWDGGEFLTFWRMGDTTTAPPVVVSRPDRNFLFQGDALGNNFADSKNTPYLNFYYGELEAQRKRIVLQASNEGFLHAFDAGDLAVTRVDGRAYGRYTSNGSGEELWAYMPRPLVGKIKDRITGWSEGALYVSWTAGKMLSSSQPLRAYGIDAEPVVANIWVDRNANGVPECDGVLSPSIDGAGLPYSRSACEWRTLAIGGLGRGGQAIYALDISDPLNPAPHGACDFTYYDATSPPPDWTIQPGCAAQTGFQSEGLAFVSAPPEIFRMRVCDNDASCTTLATPGAAGGLREVWVAAFPLGYSPFSDPRQKGCNTSPPPESEQPCYDGTSKLGRGMVLINLHTMQKILEFRYGAGLTAENNLLYAVGGGVRAFDSDDDGFADRLYFGDLGGQLWRVKLAKTLGLTGSVSGGGTVKRCTSATDTNCAQLDMLYQHAQPTGAAKGANQPWQSIWVKPAVTQLNNEVYVGFGTGDKNALLNINASRNGYFISLRDREYDASSLPVKLSDLNDSSAAEQQNYAIAASKAGWFWSLPFSGTQAAGERIIYDPVVIGSAYFFTSYFPHERRTNASAPSPLDGDAIAAPGFLTRTYYANSHVYTADVRSGGIPLEARNAADEVQSRFACCAGGPSRRSCDVLPGIATGIRLYSVTFEETPPNVALPNGVESIGGRAGAVTIPLLSTSTGHVYGVQAAENLQTAKNNLDVEAPVPNVRMLYFREVSP